MLGLAKAMPITAKQITDEPIAATKAWATIAHIHVRDRETGVPSMKLAPYREAIERLVSRAAPAQLGASRGLSPRQHWRR